MRLLLLLQFLCLGTCSEITGGLEYTDPHGNKIGIHGGGKFNDPTEAKGSK